jgi:hypothetical protein
MPETKGSSTLFAKLAQVTCEIGRVAKNGRNDFHGYDYVTESDLVDAVRDRLSGRGVAYFFSTVSIETRETGAKAGPITTVEVQVTFADADTGETFSVNGFGSGQDAGDKGIYKAITGAQKYVLMKNFLIATGDDPEADEKVDKANSEAKPAAKKAKAAEPVKEERRPRLVLTVR